MSQEQDDEIFEDAVSEPPTPTPPASPNPNSLHPTKSSEKKRLKKLKKVLKLSPSSSATQRTIPLGVSLEEARTAIDLFMNNKFDEARDIVQPLADKSIYHALGWGVFMYLKAVMTFEEKHIEEASTVLSAACDTVDSFRRKTGLADSFGRILGGKSDYDQYSEEELHAELCYAEVLLLKAVLTLCEDETLVSFVKAGLKVRSCYQSIRECWNILHQRNWDDSQYKVDFESGVRMGVGIYNLMISMLPARVMRLLEFIGFGGSREAGLAELRKVYEDKTGLRQFLASLSLLSYNLLLSFFVGNSECDLTLCEQILTEKLGKYPDGAFFLFFKGRLHFVQADTEKAIYWYKKSCNSQNEWPQFHHVCYWELFWATSYAQDWWAALEYSEKLFNESRWSKCFYGYQKAAMMCMVQDQLTDEQREEQIEIMKSLPNWKQRIAGKSLPMEKFAIRKAERFLDQENRLVLPALELIYAWNGFKIICGSPRLLESIYVLVDKEIKKVKADKSTKYFNEDLCLLHLLRGMCLKYMKSPLQAEECFKFVISFAGKLKADTYLIPYTISEYAFLLKDQGDFQPAMELLESAKNDYKDYSLQSRLHFRIHAAQTDLKRRMKLAKNEKDTPDFEDAEEVMPLKTTKEVVGIPLTTEEALKIVNG